MIDKGNRAALLFELIFVFCWFSLLCFVSFKFLKCYAFGIYDFSTMSCQFVFPFVVTIIGAILILSRIVKIYRAKDIDWALLGLCIVATITYFFNTRIYELNFDPDIIKYLSLGNNKDDYLSVLQRLKIDSIICFIIFSFCIYSITPIYHENSAPREYSRLVIPIIGFILNVAVVAFSMFGDSNYWYYFSAICIGYLFFAGFWLLKAIMDLKPKVRTVDTILQLLVLGMGGFLFSQCLLAVQHAENIMDNPKLYIWYERIWLRNGNMQKMINTWTFHFALVFNPLLAIANSWIGGRGSMKRRTSLSCKDD